MDMHGNMWYKLQFARRFPHGKQMHEMPQEFLAWSVPKKNMSPFFLG